ncbi:hypothetical protein H4219_006054 [Mycoemilia scoparia]|uniref:FHF complex subunit HOOK-interacting protein C-terminal domain-containing protein n=1 Tax=Mycoemilia scoparia TaxID=417184 RepID=A0A9W7ZQU8_9FUNG|nr:hypothetical protein H4219_006054 [Mycoemilia scoparia]
MSVNRSNSIDDDLAELLYVICSKIHGYPALLHIFFQDKRWMKSIEERSNSPGGPERSDGIVNEGSILSNSIGDATDRNSRSTTSVITNNSKSQYEFLLFSHLLRLLHKQGQVGDIARTSLLFLLELVKVETAGSSTTSASLNSSRSALEQYIIKESGFAAMVSAGLDALYSQLPRRVKLVPADLIVSPKSPTCGDGTEFVRDLQKSIENSIRSPNSLNWNSTINNSNNNSDEIVATNKPEFRWLVDSFLVHIEFIQEVLSRCPSDRVCQAVLRNFHDHFLVTILYPSVLESSDVDGSSVAIMTYIEVILRTIHDYNLVDTFMGFLLGIPEISVCAYNVGGGEGKQTPPNSNDPIPMAVPFTLRDLICTNLQSTISQDSVITALNLLRTILVHHCRFSNKLLEMEAHKSTDISTAWLMNYTVALDVHRKELEMYSNLVQHLDHGVSPHETPGMTAASPVSSVIGGHYREPVGNGMSSGHQLSSPSPMPIPIIPQKPQYQQHVCQDSFFIGYQDYLNNAIMEWEGHENYHKDHLSQAVSIHSPGINPSAPMTPPYLDSGTGTPTTGQSNANLVSLERVSSDGSGASPVIKRRSRKYSDAVHFMTSPKFNNSKTLRLIEEETSNPISSPSLPQPNQAKIDDIQKSRSVTTAELVSQLFPDQSCGHKIKRCTSSPGAIPRLLVKQSDPIMRNLFHLMTKFFAQNRECNLALTGVFSALILCPYRSLENWFSFDTYTLVKGPLLMPWQNWLKQVNGIGGVGDEIGDPAKIMELYNGGGKSYGGGDDSDSDDELSMFIRNNQRQGLPSSSSSSLRKLDSNSLGSTPRHKQRNSSSMDIDDNNGINADDQDIVDMEYEADKILHQAIKILPHGAPQPSLYTILKGLAHQAKILSLKVPYFESRMRRARNALMGIVEDEMELMEELEATLNMNDNSDDECEEVVGDPIDTASYSYNTNTNTKRSSIMSLESNHRQRSSSNSTSSRSPSVQKGLLQPLASNISERSNTPVVGQRHGSRSNSVSTHINENNESPNIKILSPGGSDGRSRRQSQSHSKNTLPSTPSLPSNTQSLGISTSASSAGGMGTTKISQALDVPPINPNMHGYLENVIILQEAIKEWVSLAQTRRENGGDESTIK